MEGIEGGAEDALSKHGCGGRNRNRDAEDATDSWEDLPATRETRYRVGYCHVALVANREVVEELAQRRCPRKKAQWNAVNAPPTEGVDAPKVA